MLNELIKNILYIIIVLINILTRTGKREKYFKTLKDSIDAQTYKIILNLLIYHLVYGVIMTDVKKEDNEITFNNLGILNIINQIIIYYNLC